MEPHPPAQRATLPTELREALYHHACAELWRRGSLRHKLHEDQLRVYDQIQACTSSRFVMEIARRWGKTWLLVVIAIETCLANPKKRVVYGAPTLNHLAKFILPIFEQVIEDAPADCRPVWNASRGEWTFPNGASIHLFGADDKRKADRGRGPAAVLAIFDEAGFTPILKYVLTSVLRPQLFTTGGRMLLGSTPAAEPDHDFTAIAERAEANGNYARRTVWDNPRRTDAEIRGFIEDDAKEEGLTPEQYQESDTFRREYLAERVIDRLLVVVPEWSKYRSELIQAIPRPQYFDALSVLDFGGNDPHAATFGYWHFELAKWVIEDEVLLRDNEHSKDLVTELKRKEKELWGVEKYDGSLRAGLEEPDEVLLDQLPQWMRGILTGEAREQPYARWCDGSGKGLAAARALYELHGMAFIPAAKDELEQQVNRVRVMIENKQLIVHPRCVHTDRHLKGTTWQDHKRRAWARKGGEHGDCLATLVYGARHLRRDRNPVPKHLRPRPLFSRPELAPAQKVAGALLGRR